MLKHKQHIFFLNLGKQKKKIYIKCLLEVEF